jgi:large subunit ribosomal protein L25
MAGERVKLQVKSRDGGGSAASRRLRGQGFVPGVLYGDGKAAHPFAVAERELRRVLTGEHGLHAILDVVLEGQQKARHAVLKDYQLDPTRARLLHIDLHEVRLDRAIQAQVVVELVGESAGVKEGGVLSQVNREVLVEALPMEVPDRLELDVSGMTIGDSLRVSDLRIPEGVTILSDPETVVASVTPPTKVELPEEVVTEEEEEAELAEGEVPPEELPEGAAEEPAEPEAGAAGEQQTTEG